jgi:uncharacterized membrane protein
MFPWTPLLPSQQIADEGFANDEGRTKETVANVFTGVGLMILAIGVALAFMWSYNRDKALFIATFATVMFVFSVNMVTYIAIIRESMSDHAFYYYLGLCTFMAFATMIIAIMFFVTFSRRAAIANMN